jgi:mannose-6-phosphate isomerase-like protein (cupin superfamily)
MAILSKKSFHFAVADDGNAVSWRCDTTSGRLKVVKYKLTRAVDVPKKAKFGIILDIYPDVGGCGIVGVTTETGHNQEFYDRESIFTYIVLQGSGSFFLGDEAVPVSQGDVLSISPKTRIYYTGKLKMVLVTTPAWKPENEVETKSSVW